MEQHLLVGLICLGVAMALARANWAAVTTPTPGGAVILMSTIYLVGATLVEWRRGSDEAFLVVCVTALCLGVYSITFFGVSHVFRLRVEAPPVGLVVAPRRRGLGLKPWILLFASISIVAIAVWVTGTDRLLLALFQFLVLGSSDDSILDLRLEFGSGSEGYLAPGYVKQFRDILMPLAALNLLFSVQRRARTFFLLAAFLLPTVALLMISSGERGPVALFMVGAIYCARRAIDRGALPSRPLVLFFALVAVIGGGAFAALTASFTSRQYDEMPFALVFMDRIVTRVPEENVDSAQLWIDGAPFVGAGWLSEIASVLPGTQQTLSNLLHEDLGGGDKGNAVLGLWVDVYYNFGWLLCVPMAMFLAIFIAIFNHWVNEQRRRSPSHDLCGIWISVTMLMVLSPFGFLLYGPFVLSFVLLLMRRADTSKAALAQLQVDVGRYSS